MGTVLPLLQRWLLFAGVLLLVGVVIWRAVIAPRAARSLAAGGSPSAAGEASDLSRTLDDVAGRVTGLAAIVAVVLVHVWLLRLVVQLMAFRDPFAPLRDDLELLIGGTTWGTVWMLQGLVLLWLAAGFLLLGMRRHVRVGTVAQPLPAPWYGVLAGVLLLVLTLALSSHAMSMDGRTVLVAADALHTLAAGAWLGSLAVILVARPRAADRAALARAQAAQLRAFSPVAIVSVSTLVLMGVWLSWQHLGGVHNLWQSRYGQVLAGKLLVVAAVLLLGLLNWRRGLPAMDDDDGVRTVRRRAAVELAAAAVVLGLTAVLTGTPMPGEGG